jgi:hypothetical protein
MDITASTQHAMDTLWKTLLYVTEMASVPTPTHVYVHLDGQVVNAKIQFASMLHLMTQEHVGEEVYVQVLILVFVHHHTVDMHANLHK